MLCAAANCRATTAASCNAGACKDCYKLASNFFLCRHHAQPFASADETDENKPPLSPGSIDICPKMPSALTERVRQQAKARTSRVKLVRKAAVNNSSVQTASLDLDQLQRPSGQNELQPKSVNGITASFQLSWPPPGAMATATGLVDAAGCNLRSSGKHSECSIAADRVQTMSDLCCICPAFF